MENLKRFVHLAPKKKGALSLSCRVLVVMIMIMCPQSPTMMSRRRRKMYWMAHDNDVEGITRLLDEGVNPAADEERWVRRVVGCSLY